MTKLFADLGAEVIKVEEKTIGDYARWEKPFLNKESYYHLIINGNKKSITLNLKDEKDKETFLELVKTADVVFENFRPGVLERLGIHYKELKKVKPDLIVCSMSGFGQDSPYRDVAAHDINFLAFSGFLSVMLPESNDAKPMLPTLPVADIFAALATAFAVSAALYERNQSGKGQYIDISMYDILVWGLSFIAGKYFVDKDAPLHDFTGAMPSYNVYPTKDNRYMAIGAYEQKFWEGFCKKLNREEYIPYGRDLGDKGKKIIEELREIFQQKTQAEWVAFFADTNICITPVRNFDEVFGDEHDQARKLTYEVLHPTEGSVKQLSHPIKYSGFQHFKQEPAPLFGENNHEHLEKGVRN